MSASKSTDSTTLFLSGGSISRKSSRGSRLSSSGIFGDSFLKKLRLKLAPVNTELGALVALYPNLLRTCQTGLEFFIIRQRNNSLERQPLGYFCHQQIILSALELQNLIREKIISYTEVRDVMNNLAELHKKVSIVHPEISSELAADHKALVTIIAELARELERIADVIPTDWSKLTELETVQTSPLEHSGIFYDYVPTISQLKELKFLGAGGSGAVYKVLYIPSTMACGLKITSWERFKKEKHVFMEAIVASVIMSPFVVLYYSCFAAQNAFITLMEYIPGINLKRLIDEVGVLDTDIIRMLAAQIFSGVEHLHLRGFVHRDIKPSNCLITSRGRIKLIDFNTSKCCLGHFTKRALKGFFRRTPDEFWDSEKVGTLSYMAPEQFYNKPYGRAVDWWAYGITIYKLSTGIVPFKGDKREDVIKDICTKTHTWPAEHQPSEPVVDFVDTFLIKSPKLRLGSVSYKDIKTHLLFKELNWQKLTTASKLCDIPNIGKIMRPSGLTAISAEDISPDPVPDTDKTLMHLKDVIDKDKTLHNPLFTYTSASFKKLLKNPLGIITSNVNTPLSISTDIEYESSAQTTSAATSSTDKTLSFAALDLGKTQEQEVAMLRGRFCGCFCLRSFGFDFIRVPGISPMRQYMYVVSIASRSSAAECLRQFDIIIALNGIKIALLNDDQIKQLILSAGKRIEVKVLEYSCSRIVCSANAVKTFHSLKQLKPMEVIIQQLSRCFIKYNSGLETDTIAVPSPTPLADEIGRYVHIVKRMLPHCNITTPPNGKLYTGDIISLVGGFKVNDKCQSSFRQLMKSINPLILTVIPCSPIRGLT